MSLSEKPTEMFETQPIFLNIKNLSFPLIFLEQHQTISTDQWFQYIFWAEKNAINAYLSTTYPYNDQSHCRLRSTTCLLILQ
jgi:hypothetical protein